MSRRFPFIILMILCTMPLSAQQPDRPLTFDASHRTRFVYWDDGLFGADGWEGLFSRHRTKAGATWRPDGEWTLRAELGNEFFSWYRHPDAPDFTLDEVYVDQLFLRWTPEKLPLAVTLGRQDLRLGDGFLFMDGGPGDGSRSLYFNAARIDLRITRGQLLTAVGFHQPDREDLLPLLHDADRRLMELTVDGGGLQYTWDVPGVQADAYYFYTDHRAERDGFDDARGSMHTTGARVGLTLGRQMHLHTEGALQRGSVDLSLVKHPGVARLDHHAWAGNAFLRWDPHGLHEQQLQVKLGGYYYSGGFSDGGGGDRARWEFWNPLFGRWPKWSESFIYTQSTLGLGIAYWTSIAAPYLELGWRPHPAVALRGTLQHMLNADRDAALHQDGTRSIGTLAILQIHLLPDEALSGHVLLERMWFDRHRGFAESYIWGRCEIQYRWR